MMNCIQRKGFLIVKIFVILYLLSLAGIQLYFYHQNNTQSNEGENYVYCDKISISQHDKRKNGVWHSIQKTCTNLSSCLNANDAIEVRFSQMYFDDRHHDGPLITTHAIINKVDISHKNLDIYCIMWTGTNSVVMFKAHRIIESGGKQELKIGKVSIYQYVISCRIPLYSQIIFATLSFKACEVSSKIKVHYASHTKMMQDLVICVPPLYANFMENEKEVTAFIEWVEIYQMLGVSQIILYNVTMTDSTVFQKVLQYYKTKEIVQAINFPPPVQYSNKRQLYQATKLSVSAALADCLLTNQYLFKHALIVDIDEIVFPQRHKDLTSYIKSLGNMDRWHSLKVYKKDFFLDYHPRGNNMDPLIISKYFNYAPIAHGWKFKAFVHTQKCEVPYEHECRLSFGTTSFTAVPFDDLILHHYRRSCFHTHQISDKGQTNFNRLNDIQLAHCKKNLNQTTFIDSSALWYRKSLLTRVQKVLRDLELSGHSY